MSRKNLTTSSEWMLVMGFSLSTWWICPPLWVGEWSRSGPFWGVRPCRGPRPRMARWWGWFEAPVSANEFDEHRIGIPHTYGRPPLHLVARWASKNLGERLFRPATSGPCDVHRFQHRLQGEAIFPGRSGCTSWVLSTGSACKVHHQWRWTSWRIERFITL